MSAAPTSPYPVQFSVEPQLTNRNRKTVFFRLFTALPHLLILGGGGMGAGYGASEGWSKYGGGLAGLEGAATTMAIVAWFAIIFWKQHPRGLWNFCNYYLHWTAHVTAYFALLRDDYPPFGEGEYPVQFDTGDFPDDAGRDRWSIGLRVIYALPHIFVLIFVGIGAAIVTMISWFVILFTGNHPEGLYHFVEGTIRWGMRVQAYLLMMRDEYPPFSLD